ncbi:MAG: hypothetical protein LIQ31_09750 [Planctomycetes bacterium]|nr:hypothetical protein [Planctomycetota bacterium]
MTTATKKVKAGKVKKSRLPLPESADKAIIAGTEYVIIPSAEFEDWYLDQMLAAVAADRLKAERKQAAPWADVVKRLKSKKPPRSK